MDVWRNYEVFEETKYNSKLDNGYWNAAVVFLFILFKLLLMSCDMDCFLLSLIFCQAAEIKEALGYFPPHWGRSAQQQRWLPRQHWSNTGPLISSAAVTSFFICPCEFVTICVANSSHVLPQWSLQFTNMNVFLWRLRFLNIQFRVISIKSCIIK